MMVVSYLDSRRNKILGFIIQTYVETAEPVGSHEVCRRFHLRISPATVRNVMGDLEEDALLSHPHTSAGRVPTDRGYRYFVDALMTPQTLLETERQAIQELSRHAPDDPIELLKTASHLISALTGQASVALIPRVEDSVLRRIDLIPVDAHRILGIVMTADGTLRHALLEFEDAVDASEMSRVARFLNEELAGESLGRVEDRLQQALMDATNAFNYLYKRAQELWALGEFLEPGEPVVMGGLSLLLTQPEFHDLTKSRQVLQAVEEQQPVASLLSETSGQGRLRLVIGHENPYPALQRCSVVSAPYRAGSRVIGAIGIIGPTRLDYPRTVSIVDQTAAAVSRAMERITG